MLFVFKVPVYERHTFITAFIIIGVLLDSGNYRLLSFCLSMASNNSDLTPTGQAVYDSNAENEEHADDDRVVRSSIEREITRFEAVHPAIYALYELIDHVQQHATVNPLTLAHQMRDHVMHIEDSFVHSQEWTLARVACDIKLGILGSLHSGKSALVHRYLTGAYLQEESPEGGRFKKQTQVDSKNYLVLIRDEAAEATTDLKQFAEWQDAIMLIFALDDLPSFQYVYKMLTTLAHFRHHHNSYGTQQQADGSVILSLISSPSSCSRCSPIFLVGTRDKLNSTTDLKRSRVVTDHHINQLKNYIANNFQNCHSSTSAEIVYHETCAKNGLNIDLVFREACRAVISRRYTPHVAAHNHRTVNDEPPYAVLNNGVVADRGQYLLPPSSASGNSRFCTASAGDRTNSPARNYFTVASPGNVIPSQSSFAHSPATAINWPITTQHFYHPSVTNHTHQVQQPRSFPFALTGSGQESIPHSGNTANYHYSIPPSTQQQQISFTQNNRMASPLQQAALVGPLFLSHMPMPTSSSPLLAGYGASPRHRLSTARSAQVTASPPILPYAVVPAQAAVHAVASRIPYPNNASNSTHYVFPRQNLPVSSAADNKPAEFSGIPAADSPSVGGRNFKWVEGKSRSTSSLVQSTNNGLRNRNEILYDTLARQRDNTLKPPAGQCATDKMNTGNGCSTLGRSFTTTQQAPLHQAAAQLLRAESTHIPLNTNGYGLQNHSLASGCHNKSEYEPTQAKHPRKRKSLSLSKKPADLRDDRADYSAASGADCGDHLHAVIGHGRPIPRKQGIMYKVNRYQSIIPSTPLLFRGGAITDEVDGVYVSGAANPNRPRVMSSLLPQRVSKQQHESSVLITAASGKRARRKKKYCVLLEGGWLVYYPSLHDYMNDKDGKRVNLAMCTVKIPGQAPHPVEQNQSSLVAPPNTLLVDSTLPDKANDNKLSNASLKAPNIRSLAEEAEFENTPESAGCRSTTLQRKAVTSTADGKIDSKFSSTDVTILSNHKSVSFDLLIISLHNRHWHFQCETYEERNEWAVAMQKEIFDALASGKAGSFIPEPSYWPAKAGTKGIFQRKYFNGDLLHTEPPGSRSAADEIFPQSPSANLTSLSLSPSYLRTHCSSLQRRPLLGAQEELTNNFIETNRMLAANIRRLPAGNDCCADCNAASPSWASLNLGVVLCIDCAGIHRQMGTHISRVRSLDLDDCWASSAGAAACMLSLGNTFMNSLLEARVKSDSGAGCDETLSTKPDTGANRDVKAAFIRAKYEQRLFLSPMLPKNGHLIPQVRDQTSGNVLVCDDSSDLSKYQTLLMNAVRVRDLGIIMHVLLTVLLGEGPQQIRKFFNYSAKPDHDGDEMLPFLHSACAAGDLVTTQLLLYYGANAGQLDGRGRTALEHAYAANSPACVEVLLRAVRSSAPSATGNIQPLRSSSSLSATLSESSETSTMQSQASNSER